MIVGDAPACIDNLRQMMTLQGCQTLVANSGERALGIARRMHPDLILLDVMMPGMDGLETCRQLKLHRGTEDIPVIFLSAANETADVVAGPDRGAVDYIGKPLRMAEARARPYPAPDPPPECLAPGPVAPPAHHRRHHG